MEAPHSIRLCWWWWRRARLFELHTLPGVVRTGILAGAVWGLALIVLAVFRAGGAARDELVPSAGGAALPFLFPLAGRSHDAIGEGFAAARGPRRHEPSMSPPRGARPSWLPRTAPCA